MRALVRADDVDGEVRVACLVHLTHDSRVRQDESTYVVAVRHVHAWK